MKNATALLVLVFVGATPCANAVQICGEDVADGRLFCRPSLEQRQSLMRRWGVFPGATCPEELPGQMLEKAFPHGRFDDEVDIDFALSKVVDFGAIRLCDYSIFWEGIPLAGRGLQVHVEKDGGEVVGVSLDRILIGMGSTPLLSVHC